MIGHMGSSGPPAVAPLAEGAAVAWGPPTARAVLADARRSDRAPPFTEGISVASACTWNPLRLLSFAVCWELGALTRSDQLSSG